MALFGVGVEPGGLQVIEPPRQWHMPGGISGPQDIKHWKVPRDRTESEGKNHVLPVSTGSSLMVGL